MKLRDVLRDVIIKLGIEDDVDIEEKAVGGKTINKLLLASNNVIRELASSYLPLIKRETIKIEDNRYDLSKLQRQVCKVISLKHNGRSVRFKMYPTYMYADNGTYEVEYSYLPETHKIDSEIECDPRVNIDILSNGIASEYALMTLDEDKGEIYDRKYRENLKNISVTNREIRIKGRAFI